MDSDGETVAVLARLGVIRQRIVAGGIGIADLCWLYEELEARVIEQREREENGDD